MQIAIIVVVILLLLLANAMATLLVLRSMAPTVIQRTLQLCVVWLLPGLGAFVVLMVYRSDGGRHGPQPEQLRPDGSEIDVWLAARHDGHN